MKRTFFGVDADGHRIIAVAKLEGIRGQSPYFSVTSERGADHGRILSVFPELKPVVDLHLADAQGVPMHAAANAAYHLENGDMEAARRALLIVDDETLTRLAGELAFSKKKIADRAKVITEEIRTGIKSEYDREARPASLLNHFSNEQFKSFIEKYVSETTSVPSFEREVKKVEERLPSRLMKSLSEWRTNYAKAPKVALAQAKSEIQPVRDYVEAFRDVYAEMAEKAKAILALPDFVADGYVGKEDDRSTFEGFARSIGLELKTAYKEVRDQMKRYSVTLTTDGRSYELEYSMGLGHKEGPALPMVLECLQGDARSAEGDFEAWCQDFGMSDDSIKAKQIFEACREVRRELTKLFGDEAAQFFMEHVGDDEPIACYADDEGRSPTL